MRRLVPLLAAPLLVAAGCGDGGSPSLKVSLLPKVVLQPNDLPKLGRYDFGRITRFDAPEGPRSDLERFGRVDGWKADYKASGTSTTPGALVVHSQADLFDDADGARRDLGAYESQFRAARDAAPSSTRLFEPTVGDDAHGLALAQGGTPPLHVYTVAWVHGPVSASITVNGFKGLTAADVVRLARRQERRIERAESG